jgi:ADP-ribose pyrophosphatase YjhB (NUDIX family)/hemerythrin superfamily protein
VCEAEDHLLVVRLRDPATGVEAFYPPGGGVEEREAPAAAARRETLEETGVSVEIDPASELVARYPFVWNAIDHDVTTHFFLARAAKGELRDVVDADYHRGAQWLLTIDALDELAVNPAIAAPVARVLNRARRPKWESHARFAGGLAATLLGMHDEFRAAAARVVAEPRFFGPLVDVLALHHHAEESMLFPFVRKKTGKAPARLIHDHGELTRAIAAATDEPSTERLSRFTEVLLAHLDREELEVVPVLLSADSHEVFAGMRGG